MTLQTQPPLAIAVLVSLVATSSLGAQQEGPVSPACASEEARQFDFWHGEWDVRPTALSRETGEFEEIGRATARIYPALDGCVTVEHWKGSLGGRPVDGFSIRAYDPEAGRWVLVLSWPGPDQPGFFTLEGAFHHGRGEFFREAEGPDGTPRTVRFSFGDIRGDTFRWENAFSEDGASWTTGAIWEFTRRPVGSRALFNGPTPAGEDPGRCAFPQARQLDFLVGDWSGTTESGEVVRSEAFQIVGGCALLEFMEIRSGEGDRYRLARVTALDRDAGVWVQYRIDDATPVFERLEGALSGGTLRLTSAGPPDGGLLRRTRWSPQDDGSLLLEEMESRDGGATWSSRRAVRLEKRRIRRENP